MKTLHITRVRVLSAATSRPVLAAMIAAGTVAGGSGAALAAGLITNDATATGTYNGSDYTSPIGSASVNIADPTQALTVVKTGVINDGGDGVDAGDTITFTVNVQNDSNVTITSVAPSEDGIVFGAAAGTGSFGSFSPASVDLAPGASQDFTITYTLSQADIYNAAGQTDGVVNTASASGTGPGGAVSGNDDSQNTIPADPTLTIAKSATFANPGDDANGNGMADVGDLITYTYLVTNTGNVPLSGITINDTHEPGGAGELILSSASATSSTTGPYDETETTADPLGNNADAGTDGTWDTLGAGGAVTFTYVHTVTQAEFEEQ
ncbi:MAG: hypothetical protein H6891_09170 [Brucellaceae bacterium]|nr:hypothetical protein [Brucellaceae bacterium]